MAHSPAVSPGCGCGVNWGNGFRASSLLGSLQRTFKKGASSPDCSESGEELEGNHSIGEVAIGKRYGWLGTIRTRGRRPQLLTAEPSHVA